MNRPRSWVAFAIIAVSPLTGYAGQITFSHHEANAWVSANVFDGGPVVSNSATLADPLSDEFFVSAADETRVGSFGALAWASGRSDIVGQLDGGIRLFVEFSALYDPSDFASGDRPGGMAEGALHSVIEFRMPTNSLFWAYGLSVNDTARFAGSTAIRIENITQDLTILTLSEDLFPVKTTLNGRAGDLVRITSDIEGSGSVPADFFASYQYGAALDMIFRIPEPSTLFLLLTGAAMVAQNPRKRHP